MSGGRATVTIRNGGEFDAARETARRAARELLSVDGGASASGVRLVRVRTANGVRRFTFEREV